MRIKIEGRGTVECAGFIQADDAPEETWQDVTYQSTGAYSSVTISVGDSIFYLKPDADGSLHVRAEGIGDGTLVVFPVASNEITVKAER